MVLAGTDVKRTAETGTVFENKEQLTSRNTLSYNNIGDNIIIKNIALQSF